jgi:cysteine desulfurase
VIASEPVYLDYAATTPVAPAVAAAMGRCLTEFDYVGNASSVTHRFGRRAAARIELARVEVAALIGAAPAEIVFTSGATESNNLAILGAARANAYRGRHIVSSRIEHKAVLDPLKRLEKEGFTVTLLAPDRRGRIDPEAVAAALRPDTVLASIMLVNNEIGAIADVAAIGALCRAHGVLLHSDAAQAAGKIPLDVHALPLDFASITAHKLYGPKGVGALYVRPEARAHLQPVLFGGGQERGLRPGTLSTHQIAGFGVACDLARRELTAEHARLAGLRDRLWRGLAMLEGVHANGEGACVPGILNVSFEGVEGESLVAGLAELAVATGSACNSASAEPSYVLRALGRDTQLAQSSLRLSFGRFSVPEHIDVAVAAIQREVVRLRELSPASEPRGGPGERGYGLRAPGSPSASQTAGQTVGEAGGPGQEVWVRFRLQIADGVVKSALFKAYGCPHTLAVAAWVTDRLCGRGRVDLAPGTPPEWAEALAVPVEKLGRLLVVEDALADCARHWPEQG